MHLPPLLHPRALCAGAALLLALMPQAHAQYSWIDAGGARVFSDRPPPPGTPPSRILKAPRAAVLSPYGETAPAAAAAPSPAPAPAAASPTVAERERAYRERAAKQKEADDKSARENQRQAALAGRCKALKQQEAALNAGTRLSEVDDKGEQRYIGDEERAGRLAEVRRRQAEECR